MLAGHHSQRAQHASTFWQRTARQVGRLTWSAAASTTSARLSFGGLATTCVVTCFLKHPARRPAARALLCWLKSIPGQDPSAAHRMMDCACHRLQNGGGSQGRSDRRGSRSKRGQNGHRRPVTKSMRRSRRSISCPNASNSGAQLLFSSTLYASGSAWRTACTRCCVSGCVLSRVGMSAVLNPERRRHAAWQPTQRPNRACGDAHTQPGRTTQTPCPACPA